MTSGRDYPGWRIVAISIVDLTLVLGTTFSAFGLFVLPVSAEFGLSRADMNTATVLPNLGAIVLAPLIGKILDRWPLRRIMACCSVVLGVSFAMLALSSSVWLSGAVLLVALPIAYLGAGTLTMTVLVARWFVAQRGRAMALSNIGMQMGGVAVVPLLGLSIEAHGWRATLAFEAVVVTAALLLLTILAREPPRTGVSEGRAGETSTLALGAGPPRASFLRQPTFWLISISAAIAMAVSQALIVTFVPLALEVGATMPKAAGLMSAMGVGAVVGTLSLAVVADRIDRRLMLIGMFLAGASINALLLASDGYTVLLIGAVGLGIVNGVVAPAFYALLADSFGLAVFGAVRGWTTPIIACAGIVSVRFAGTAFDRTGGYELAFSMFAAAGVVAAAIMLSVLVGARLSTPRDTASRKATFSNRGAG